MDKTIDFTTRPTAPLVITSIEGRSSQHPGCRMVDIECTKPGVPRRRFVVHAQGEPPQLGWQLIHKKLGNRGFAAMWSDSAEARGTQRLMGGGFTPGAVASTWRKQPMQPLEEEE